MNFTAKKAYLNFKNLKDQTGSGSNSPAWCGNACNKTTNLKSTDMFYCHLKVYWQFWTNKFSYRGFRLILFSRKKWAAVAQVLSSDQNSDILTKRLGTSRSIFARDFSFLISKFVKLRNQLGAMSTIRLTDQFESFWPAEKSKQVLFGHLG